MTMDGREENVALTHPGDVRSTVSQHATEVEVTHLRDAHSQTRRERQCTGYETVDDRRQSDSSSSSISHSDIGTVVQGGKQTFIIGNYNVFTTMECNHLQMSECKAETEGQTPAGNFNWVALSQKIKIDRNRLLCHHAEVYYGEQDMGGISRELAVKLLKKTEKSVSEARFLVRLESHPNIIRIIDYGNCGEGPIPHIFIAMELCHQNLDQYVKNCPFNLPKASSFFQQTVSAINHIHAKNVAHGDLKPSNILVTFDKNSVKVSDFGVSKAIPGDKSRVTSTSAGTEGFKAPESYERGTHTSGYKADIYPLAINGYFIFTHGKHPFGPYSFDWVHNIVHNKKRDLSLVPLFPEPRSHRRPQLIRLFKRMLESDPEDRLTAQDVQNDVFFSESSQGVEAEEDGTRTTSSSYNAAYKSIVEVLQNSEGKLHADAIDKLSVSLIAAKKKLKEGKSEESLELVRQAIPESINAVHVNKIGKKLEDEHPVFSIILHRVAAQIFNIKDVSPDEAVTWISERVSDIRFATEHIMDSESNGNSRYIAINISPKYMVELLQDLCEVENAKGEVKTVTEVSCIICITRIHINAGRYPDVTPKKNIIDMCQNGLTCLENEFGANVRKYKFYGYLLNNIGEAFMQLCQFDNAKMHFQKALDVKKEATYRSREAKLSDIDMTKNNLRECTLQRSNGSSIL